MRTLTKLIKGGSEMKFKNFLITLLGFTVIFGLLASTAFSLTILDSSSFSEDLNNGAIITDSAADPSTFSNEFWTYGDTDILVSNQDPINPPRPLYLGEVPYVDLDGFDYFFFVYDLQETGQAGSELVWIEDIVISSGGTTIWDFDQVGYGPIILNSQAPYSDTPLGDGGDLALYLPMDLFAGLGPESPLLFEAMQSNSNNGKDEWVITGEGFFIVEPIDPGDPLVTPVPEPSTFLLLGAGLGGLAYLARRKRKE